MDIELSSHAELKIKERRISQREIEEILTNPNDMFLDIETGYLVVEGARSSIKGHKLIIVYSSREKRQVGKNKMISRYNAESDILYLVIKEGEIKDTVEVSEDMFIEYDENDNLVGIELWRARKNVLGEFMKYINTISKIKGGRISKKKTINLIPQ